jgi:hypothetical protein
VIQLGASHARVPAGLVSAVWSELRLTLVCVMDIQEDDEVGKLPTPKAAAPKGKTKTASETYQKVSRAWLAARRARPAGQLLT